VCSLFVKRHKYSLKSSDGDDDNDDDYYDNGPIKSILSVIKITSAVSFLHLYLCVSLTWFGNTVVLMSDTSRTGSLGWFL
jgi:hypothetical protein